MDLPAVGILDFQRFGRLKGVQVFGWKRVENARALRDGEVLFGAWLRL